MTRAKKAAKMDETVTAIGKRYEVKVPADAVEAHFEEEEPEEKEQETSPESLNDLTKEWDSVKKHITNLTDEIEKRQSQLVLLQATQQGLLSRIKAALGEIVAEPVVAKAPKPNGKPAAPRQSGGYNVEAAETILTTFIRSKDGVGRKELDAVLVRGDQTLPVQAVGALLLKLRKEKKLSMAGQGRSVVYGDPKKLQDKEY